VPNVGGKGLAGCRPDLLDRIVMRALNLVFAET
jgi:hypothetical protein